MKLIIFSFLSIVLLSGCSSQVRYDLIGPQSVDLKTISESE